MRKFVFLMVLMLFLAGCMRGQEKPAEITPAASLEDALPTTLPPDFTSTPPQTTAAPTPAPTQPPQTPAPTPPPTTAPPAPKTGLQVVWKHQINETVNAVDMTGTRVAAGSVNHYFYLYDLEDGTELLKKQISKTMVEDIGITDSGDYIALAGSRLKNGEVYLMRKTGTQSCSEEIGDEVRGIAISGDGNYIAAGSEDRNVYLLNRRCTVLWSYPTQESPWGVWDVDISSSGEYIAAGGDDKTLYLLDKDGELVWSKTLERKSGMPSPQIYGVAVSPEAGYVAASSQDTYVYFFDRAGNFLWEYKTGDSAPAVAISTDGERTIVGSENGNIYYLDRNGKLIQNLNLGSGVKGVAISDDGIRMSASTKGGDVYLIEYLSE